MDRNLLNSATSRRVKRNFMEERPTFYGEVIRSFFAGKAFILSLMLYSVGKPLFECIGRESLLAWEKIIDDEDQRLDELDRQ